MMKRLLCLVFMLLVPYTLPAWSGAEAADYLKMVRDYADAMLEHGRDRYGTQHSPSSRRENSFSSKLAATHQGGYNTPSEPGRSQ